MQGTIQLIQYTPEQLQEAIKETVRNEFEAIRRELKLKEQTTEFLTRNEVKDMLQVDLSTIHNWCKRGKLKAYGIGHRVYFKRHEVLAVIKPLQ